MAAHLLILSDRKEDLEFGAQVAETYGLVLHSTVLPSQAEAILSEHAQTLVFWAVDDPHAGDPKHPRSAQTMGQLLLRLISPERVVAVSDKQLKDTPYLFHVPAFNHYVHRRVGETAFRIYSRIGMACLRPDPFGLAQYMPEGTSVQKVTLKRASHRAPAVEAVTNIFTKAKGHPRLVSMVAQTCDELLMNAIFSAPVDASGQKTRAKIARTEDFELKGKDEVTLELAATEDCFAILAADQYGSLQKEQILPFIQKDYQTHAYRPTQGASAGLGLYSIVQSGQSLLFISKPKVRTEVALIFPLAKTPREFKESFRFFSFILK